MASLNFIRIPLSSSIWTRARSAALTAFITLGSIGEPSSFSFITTRAIFRRRTAESCRICTRGDIFVRFAANCFSPCYLRRRKETLRARRVEGRSVDRCRCSKSTGFPKWSPNRPFDRSPPQLLALGCHR